MARKKSKLNKSANVESNMLFGSSTQLNVANTQPDVVPDINKFEEQYLSADAYKANIIKESIENRYTKVKAYTNYASSYSYDIQGLSVIQTPSNVASVFPEEALKLFTTVSSSNDGNIDACNKRIINCKIPYLSSDVATKLYVNNALISNNDAINNRVSVDFILLNANNYNEETDETTTDIYKLFVNNGVLSIELQPNEED